MCAVLQIQLFSCAHLEVVRVLMLHVWDDASLAPLQRAPLGCLPASVLPLLRLSRGWCPGFLRIILSDGIESGNCLVSRISPLTVLALFVLQFRKHDLFMMFFLLCDDGLDGPFTGRILL